MPETLQIGPDDFVGPDGAIETITAADLVLAADLMENATETVEESAGS